MLGFKAFLEHALWPFWLNLLIVSPLAIATILERFYSLLFRYQSDAKNFMQKIEQYVLANDLTQAINYCNTTSSPLAKVCKAALVKANRGGMAADRDGAPVFLAKSAWELGYVAEKFPHVTFLKTRERHEVHAGN